MFKLIKQLFKTDNNYYAGLPFTKKQSEPLPCVAMQSEIIANELVGEKQGFSEPVNLIVESLKEEGRWTWEFVDSEVNYKKHYKLLDNKTNFTVNVYLTSFSAGNFYYADSGWASHKERVYMGEELMNLIKEDKRRTEKEQKEKARYEVMDLYKKAANES